MLVVLASRSPRRRELLQQVFPQESIVVIPPADAQEPSFEGVTHWPAIEQQLLAISRAKLEDVVGQLAETPTLVIAADTVIAAPLPDDQWMILGQPPEGPEHAETVRNWFCERLAGKTHLAATGLTVASAGAIQQRVVRSQVSFRQDSAAWVDWYLSTGEPHGKAGGYAIQGLGSVFVTSLQGSLSNVVGLPLEELLDVCTELNIHVDSSS